MSKRKFMFVSTILLFAMILGACAPASASTDAAAPAPDPTATGVPTDLPPLLISQVNPGRAQQDSGYSATCFKKDFIEEDLELDYETATYDEVLDALPLHGYDLDKWTCANEAKKDGTDGLVEINITPTPTLTPAPVFTMTSTTGGQAWVYGYMINDHQQTCRLTSKPDDSKSQNFSITCPAGYEMLDENGNHKAATPIPSTPGSVVEAPTLVSVVPDATQVCSVVYLNPGGQECNPNGANCTETTVCTP